MYVVCFARICVRYHSDLLSNKPHMHMQTSYWHIIMWYDRHFNPLFENGWHDDGECSSSASDDEDTLAPMHLDIPLSIILAEHGVPTDLNQQTTNHDNSWNQRPSQKVLTIVRSLDFHKIMASYCCSLKCLSKFDLQLIRACRICYLSMSQAASHQWLCMMMENQPLHQQWYHIQHQVPLF